MNKRQEDNQLTLMSTVKVAINSDVCDWVCLCLVNLLSLLNMFLSPCGSLILEL